MKKCSHTAHETLSELNITPLLDLAFVLLVIFIITTTPIVNDLELNLPNGSRHAKDPPRMVQYITVEANGKLWLEKEESDITGLQEKLLAKRLENPEISVIIRGDGKAKYQQIRAVLDVCQQVNIVKVDLATEAADKK
jgi:biopolymer transport protein ExbD